MKNLRAVDRALDRIVMWFSATIVMCAVRTLLDVTLVMLCGIIVLTVALHVFALVNGGSVITFVIGMAMTMMGIAMVKKCFRGRNRIANFIASRRREERELRERHVN